MRKRVSGDALVLVGFLLLLALASARIAATGQEGSPESRPHRTVTSTQPGGWKALRLLLEKRGRKTALLRKSAQKWPQDVKVVVTGPEWFDLGSRPNLWTEDEAKAALEWVTKGGTLAVFADGGNELTRALGFEETDGDPGPQEAVPCDPTESLSGVVTVALPDADQLGKLPPSFVPLLKTKESVQVAVARRGRGRILIVGSAAFCDNAHLGEKDNARFVAALVDTGKETIYFDEYRQGFDDGQSLIAILGAPGRGLLWQIGGVLALLALSAGWRFGLPVPLPPKRRLSSEYVSSVGDLYRRAGAKDAALQAALDRLRTDLAGRVGLSSDTPDDELVARAAAALGGADPKGLARKLKSLLDDGVAALEKEPKNFSSRELLELAQRIETVRKETGIDRV